MTYPRQFKKCPIKLKIKNVVKDLNYLTRIVENSKPDIIVNCIGILVKACEENHLNALLLNACFPYVLADMTKSIPTKIIHLSTDCVFNGKKGKYSETDEPDGEGMYPQTKILGELNDGKNLTLRLSIIGDELKDNGSGLFHWITSQTDMTVKGYARAMWNGITTLELAKQLDKIINTDLTGIYHLAPDFNISKFTLLRKIIRIFKKAVTVIPDYKFKQDKTLVNNRIKEYDPCIPDYETQLIEMKEWNEK